MKKLRLSFQFRLGLLVSILILLFQNCSSPLTAVKLSGAPSTSSITIPSSTTDIPGTQVPAPSPAPAPAPSPMPAPSTSTDNAAPITPVAGFYPATELMDFQFRPDRNAVSISSEIVYFYLNAANLNQPSSCSTNWVDADCGISCTLQGNSNTTATGWLTKGDNGTSTLKQYNHDNKIETTIQIKNITVNPTPFTVTCSFGSGANVVSKTQTWNIKTGAQNPDLAHLSSGKWYEVPNSHVSDLNFCQPGSTTYINNKTSCDVLNTVEGQSAVMSSWSGGAWDSSQNRMLIFGGGHYAYGGNEVYAFQTSDNSGANVLKWTRIKDPTMITNNDVNCTDLNGIGYACDGKGPHNTTSHYFDGAPSSHHTYSYLEYVPPLNGFFCFGASASYGYPQSGYLDVDMLDLSSMLWKPKAIMPTYNDYPGDVTGGKAIFDSYDPGDAPKGVVWYHGGLTGPLRRYNVATDSWNSTRIPYDSELPIPSTPVLEPVHHLMVVVGGAFDSYGYGKVVKAGIWVWDLNQYPLYPKPPFTPTLVDENGNTPLPEMIDALGATAPGVVYYPVDNKIYIWAGGEDLFSLEVKTDNSGNVAHTVLGPDGYGNMVNQWVATAPWVLKRIRPIAAQNNDLTRIIPTSSEGRGTYGRFRYDAKNKIFVGVNRTGENVFIYKP